MERCKLVLCLVASFVLFINVRADAQSLRERWNNAMSALAGQSGGERASEKGKAEVVTLKGTLYEPVTFTLRGQTHRIESLPYEFTVYQGELPLNIVLNSANYEYRPIVIPKYSKSEYRVARQTGDKIRRTYLVYGERRFAPVSQYVAQQQNSVVETPSSRVPEVEERTSTILSDIDNVPAATEANNVNTFVLIFANENYQEVENVDYAIRDGELFKKYCTAILGVPEENIHYKSDATLNNIFAGIDWITRVCNVYKDEANVIFYYAGHGIPDEASGTSYLLPVDGYGTNVKTGYSLDDLYKALGELPTKQTTVLMDACFSGAKRGDGMLVAARGVAIKAKPSTPTGNMIVLSATQGDETAYPYKEQGHGLFTYYLLKKLRETNGQCTLGELAQYVIQQVSRRSIVVNGKSQTPVANASPGIVERWSELRFR
ncbi:MAG: caspase family protein [Bacteroidaceae bacterium]|nr:caspase family protein [Bacteroidaceae bacterium]